MQLRLFNETCFKIYADVNGIRYKIPSQEYVIIDYMVGMPVRLTLEQRYKSVVLANPFGLHDAFWDWFNNGTARQNYQKQYYQSSYSNYQRNKNYTKFDLMINFLLKIFQIFMGFFLIKILIWFFPFGPLVCLGIIINGFSGAINSLRMLKNFNADGK